MNILLVAANGCFGCAHEGDPACVEALSTASEQLRRLSTLTSILGHLIIKRGQLPTFGPQNWSRIMRWQYCIKTGNIAANKSMYMRSIYERL